MAVETLSPDWEFDRVDDGSQSKGAYRARAAGGCSPARLSSGSAPAGGLCVAVAAQPSCSGHLLPLGVREGRAFERYFRGQDPGGGGSCRPRQGSASGAAALRWSPWCREPRRPLSAAGGRAGRAQGGPAARGAEAGLASGLSGLCHLCGAFSSRTGRGPGSCFRFPVFLLFLQSTFGSLSIFSAYSYNGQDREKALFTR